MLAALKQTGNDEGNVKNWRRNIAINRHEFAGDMLGFRAPTKPTLVYLHSGPDLDLPELALVTDHCESCTTGKWCPWWGLSLLLGVPQMRGFIAHYCMVGQPILHWAMIVTACLTCWCHPTPSNATHSLRSVLDMRCAFSRRTGWKSMERDLGWLSSHSFEILSVGSTEHSNEWLHMWKFWVSRTADHTMMVDVTLWQAWDCSHGITTGTL